MRTICLFLTVLLVAAVPAAAADRGDRRLPLTLAHARTAALPEIRAEVRFWDGWGLRVRCYPRRYGAVCVGSYLAVTCALRPNIPIDTGPCIRPRVDENLVAVRVRLEANSLD